MEIWLFVPFYMKILFQQLPEETEQIQKKPVIFMGILSCKAMTKLLYLCLPKHHDTKTYGGVEV